MTSLPVELFSDNTTLETMMTSAVDIESGPNISLVYTAIGIFAILGNGLVIIVFVRVPKMKRHISNVFLYNQSIVDMLAGIMLATSSSLRGTPSWIVDNRPLNEIYCRLWLSKVTLWACLLVSTYNVIAVTAERYLSIVHPVFHRAVFDIKMSRKVIFVTWLAGVSFVFAYMIPTSAVNDQNVCQLYVVWPNLEVQRSVGCFIIFIQYFLPLAIIIFGYTRIFRRLAVEVPTMKGVRENDNNALKRRVRRNVLRTLSVVSICFVICWTPNQILYTAFNLGVFVDFNSYGYHSTVVAVMLNCCCNPVIYAVTYKRFQKAAKQTFFSRCDSQSDGKDYTCNSERESEK